MKKLLLVKHSLPHIDEAKPSREWALSEEGRARCAWLGERFAEHGVTKIISSTEPKAIETAQLAAQQIGLTSTPREGLHENDRTGLGFLSSAALRQRILDFFNNPDQLVIGTETANAALVRFSAAVEFALAQSSGETLAIVTHGTVITLFAARHNPIDAFALWESQTLPGVVVVDAETFAFDTVLRYPE